MRYKYITYTNIKAIFSFIVYQRCYLIMPGKHKTPLLLSDLTYLSLSYSYWFFQYDFHPNVSFNYCTAASRQIMQKFMVHR